MLKRGQQISERRSMSGNRSKCYPQYSLLSLSLSLLDVRDREKNKVFHCIQFNFHYCIWVPVWSDEWRLAIRSSNSIRKIFFTLGTFPPPPPPPSLLLLLILCLSVAVAVSLSLSPFIGSLISPNLIYVDLSVFFFLFSFYHSISPRKEQEIWNMMEIVFRKIREQNSEPISS